MPRARLYFAAEAEEGQAQSINLIRTLPYNAELLQWSIYFKAVPPIATAPEDLVIQRITPTDFGVASITLFEDSPAELEMKTHLCTGLWQFKQGDTIGAIYPNAGDTDVWIEFVFREAE